MLHEFLGWLIAAFLVVLTIGLHYELIRCVSDKVLPWIMHRSHDRRAMLVVMTALMLGHIVEIWIFAVAMTGVAAMPAFGHLSGVFENSFGDFLYFSAVSYTSLGLGDIMPHGALRAIAVSETLAGLMMIAWSASFTYLKMEQIWDRHRRAQDVHKPHDRPPGA
jgi:uncharacterized sodium:solute symporter family permease YidK